MRQDTFRKPAVIVKTRLPPRTVKPVILPVAAPASELEPLHSGAPRKPLLPPASQTLRGWPLIGHPHQEHVPYQSGQLGGVQLYRCRCGLLLVESGGALWWVPVTSAIERIQTIEAPAKVLGQRCWQSHAHRDVMKAYGIIFAIQGRQGDDGKGSAGCEVSHE